MAKFVNYKRIVLYQPRSGWVADLGPGRCKAPLYSMSEGYFDTGAGTRKAVSRARELIIPVFDEDTVDHLRIMHKEGCEVRAIVIGDGTSLVWEMDSAINFVENNEGIGGFSGANIVLHNSIKNGSIYQANDLLSGIPWTCETAATASDGNVYLPGPTGYSGNRWVAGSDNVVDEDGILSGTGDPELTMYFPLEGATFSLGGNFIGDMETLDYSGSVLTTTTKNTPSAETGTIDTGTWKIHITVNSATTRPTLTITDAGSLADPRPGGCIACSDLTATLSTAPGWSS